MLDKQQMTKEEAKAKLKKINKVLEGINATYPREVLITAVKGDRVLQGRVIEESKYKTKGDVIVASMEANHDFNEFSSLLNHYKKHGISTVDALVQVMTRLGYEISFKLEEGGQDAQEAKTTTEAEATTAN